MVSKGEGQGEASMTKLQDQIHVMKYLLVFTNAIEFMLGISILALCLWLRFEQGITEWLTKLNAMQFYNGIYVLIVAALIIIVVSFVGCLGAHSESQFVLVVYIGTQVVAFIFGLIGSTILLDNSARDSRFQPAVRETMRYLIMNSNWSPQKETLQMIQEGIGCCGADGPRDYLDLRQPLPNECRDTVTGNPFFYGCVNELTWFFEEKCGWLSGLVMTVCLFHVVNVVISIVLGQALKKEQDNL